MSEIYAMTEYDWNLNLKALAAQGMDAVLAELQKTRKLYEDLDAIIEDSRDGFFITDGQANCLRVNKAYEEMSGSRREELIGKNMRDMEQVIIDKSASLSALRAGREVTIEQLYLRTQRTAYITSTPIHARDGSIRLIVSNNRDFKEIDQLKQQLESTLELNRQREQKIRAIVSQSVDRTIICTQDSTMFDVLYLAGKVAKTDSPVLISGETGTGKEEIARYIHRNSLRAEQAYCTLNCGAIPKELMESELFGYEKGAFTGASTSGKLGIFEVADEGTLFLDEIGEMPLELQSKLLRVLQQGEFTRLGGVKPVRVNVRVIAATNRDLLSMVQKQQFRADLYYRLHVVPITVPPLREHKEDIVPLADYFLHSANDRYQTDKVLSQQAYNALRQYDWPGNVRELKNFVEQLVIVSDSSIISIADMLLYRPMFLEQSSEQELVNLKSLLERTEYDYIKKYHEEFGTLQRVAEKLGINIKTLSRRKRFLESRYGAGLPSASYK